ncbi:MAG: hypothetical protein ACLFV3_04130 [Phycisphaeraceae bacterium]
MPRRILPIGLTLLLITCGLAGTILWRSSSGTQASAGAATRVELVPGPWGELRAAVTLLSPPPAAEAPMPRSRNAIRWHLPDTSRHELADLLAGLDLPDALFERLLAAARPDLPRSGFVLTPDAETVRAIAPAGRARLYQRLAQHPANRDQINAFRFWGRNAATWLAGAGLARDTLDIVRPMTYQSGSFICFADMPAVAGLIDAPERARLWRALARERSLRLELVVPPGPPTEDLIDYWTALGRNPGAAERIEAVARRGGGAIDVAELLPPFARQRLGRYPDSTDPLPNGLSRDCHWSALNFFRDEPDDRFADAAHVTRVLEQTYVAVEHPALGDLVVFSSDGEIYHSAVWIAAGVVLTKNGPRPSRPWMLLPLEVMRNFYPRSGPIRVNYLRPRDRLRE